MHLNAGRMQNRCNNDRKIEGRMRALLIRWPEALQHEATCTRCTSHIHATPVHMPWWPSFASVFTFWHYRWSDKTGSDVLFECCLGIAARPESSSMNFRRRLHRTQLVSSNYVTLGYRQ